VFSVESSIIIQTFNALLHNAMLSLPEIMPLHTSLTPKLLRSSNQATCSTSERTAEKAIRRFSASAQRKKIAARAPINIYIDVARFVTEEHERLQDALNAGNLAEIILQYPVRETPALTSKGAWVSKS